MCNPLSGLPVAFVWWSTMFMLEGGPRQGQLVDELPLGYVAITGDDSAARVIIFDDFMARKARWVDSAKS